MADDVASFHVVLEAVPQTHHSQDHVQTVAECVPWVRTRVTMNYTESSILQLAQA